MPKPDPPPQCDHPEGYWRMQVVEEVYWHPGEQQYKFRLVRKKFWWCEKCRGIKCGSDNAKT